MRKGKFTASEIWKLMGKPKDKNETWSETAKTYILEKAVEQATGYRKQISSKEMEHGIMTEPEAFENWVRVSGLQYTYTAKEFFAINEISGASPDGVLYDGLDVISVCDLKCPQPMTFMELITERPEVDNKYFYQLQMQMLATKCDIGYLVYYLANEFVNTYTNEVEFTFEIPLHKRIYAIQIKEDKEVQEKMMEKIFKAEELKQEYIKSIL
jgi:hypothetical protein